MNLTNVDLNLLVALDALLAERHVTRAAERLSVGQPAMSATLRRLRRLFDDELLVRSGDSMARTPLAESLVRPVRDALHAAQRVLDVGRRFDPATDDRTFTVVASDYVGLVLLKPLTKRLARTAPRVALVVRPVAEGFLTQIRRDRVDLAIVPREIMPTVVDLPSTDLFSDRFVVAVDAARGCQGPQLDPASLTNRSWISTWDDARLDSGARIPRVADDLIAVELSTQTSLLAPFLVSGTNLATPILERMAGLLGTAAGIRAVDPPDPAQSITEAMYWSPRKTADPGHQWLRAEVERVAEELSR